MSAKGFNLQITKKNKSYKILHGNCVVVMYGLVIEGNINTEKTVLFQ